MADLNALLLQALTASGSEKSPSIKDLLLSNLNSDAPEAALLANYLNRQGENELSNKEKNGSVPLYRSSLELETKIEEMEKTIQQLRERQEKENHIYAEIEDLREKNEMLSAALGACYCWGKNPQCPDCDGRGRTGTFLPDTALFAKFVLPAIQIMKTRKKA